MATAQTVRMTLRFVTKTDIWTVEHPAAKRALAPSENWRLKSIQDAMAIERLATLEGRIVGEIGGGDSRVLPLLAERNTCYNIDPFDGSGGGLTKVVTQAGVTTIRGAVGAPLDWPDASFDVLFSISVVEHVPQPSITAFFDDCARLLRPGGTLLHLIDVYLDDAGPRRLHLAERIGAYRAPFETWLEASGPVIELKAARFSCAFATNPDFTMQRWNISNPNLADKRAISQSCSLLMEGRKRT